MELTSCFLLRKCQGFNETETFYFMSYVGRDDRITIIVSCVPGLHMIEEILEVQSNKDRQPVL
jgi:hypothetical protein